MLISPRYSSQLRSTRLLIHRRRTIEGRMYSENGSRGYKEAIVALNSLQSNASVLASIQAAGPQPGERVFGQTTYYLRRLGYKPRDLNVLNAIHISGTKGKGSTAAFCSTLLSTINPSAKVGLFTSPHLVAVRERIRINGKPISEEVFARYFWELWERFEDGHGEPVRADLPIRPAYFRYLTYMSYHAFIAERVDATIFEVGVSIMFNVLGHSLGEIAGHKGGIFKPGVPALSIQQQYPETIDVLRARAHELKSSSFTVVPPRPDLDQLVIGLAGTHQKQNAAFAIALVNTFLGSPRLPSSYSSHASQIQDTTASATPSDRLPPLPLDPSPRLPDNTDHRLSSAPRPCVTWYLDGAHTVDSLELCGNGGIKNSSHLFPHPRNPVDGFFDQVIITSNTTYSDGKFKSDLRSVATDTQSDPDHLIQHEIAEAWKSIPKSTRNVMVTGSIEQAVQEVVKQNKSSRSTSVLVTGSLHLIGGLLDVAGFEDTL
ncbi:hypothetical protein PSTT_09127 [Puccinia striiformis]|uniref:tetrahydrofolate synthase n=1 Tax=Puccinia striiformis TaxID=27350 RepID=A0A2S4V9Q6_9BASI|nr:hypothetical protein PSTT_09127 [Puccinia striiformis]